MNLADILNQDFPVPGAPTEKWGYCPERKCGYLRMSEEDYRAFPAINNSLLKCQTLAEMYALITAPQQKDTEALAVGTLADMAILTPEEPITSRFVAADVPINPTTNKAYGLDTKKAEEAVEAARAANPGKFVVSLDVFLDYQTQLAAIRAAFNRSALCVAALENAMLQVTGIMWHPRFNCWVKWKPDVLPTKSDGVSGWAIRDLKTSRHHVSKFEKDCREFDYFGQAVWYGDCHETAMERLGITLRVSNFDFLVVGKADEGARRPRPAMARKIRLPMDPSLNSHVVPAHKHLLPADGMGRVDMFLAALQEHLAAPPEPGDREAIARIWTAYDHDSEPFILCKVPREF
jgi:hypothetical protein